MTALPAGISWARKTGDRAASIAFVLMADDTPVNLTNADDVALIMRPRRARTAGTPALAEACVVTLASGGECRYDPSSTFAALPAGDYRIEVEVTWNDGRKQTFPNDGHDFARLVQDLGTLP